MPHMSLFELLFALLLVCVLAGVAAVALLAWNLTRRADGQATAVAELGLQLPGGKLLPIDSKWVSSGALEQLAEPGLDAQRRAQLNAQVEREVERRVREVSQYIDPAVTSTFALAVIPDAAYDVCRGAIVGAHRRHVMVVGYAMALPYLLTLYQLHLQFARTVDMEKLQSALIDVERHLDTLEARSEEHTSE